MINFDNTAPVKLKGAGSGLWITIDPSHPESEIIAEIDRLFEKIKHLAINVDIVLDTGDVGGQEELVDRIKSHLKSNFELGTISTSPKKRSIPTERRRQRDLSRGWNHHKSDVLMLRGRVRSGQKINAGKHLVITGDVNPGAELTAGGDIIVLGTLAGKVHAGYPKNDGAMIFSLVFNPSLVKIGLITATGASEPGTQGPEFACVEQGIVVVKNYMKENPFKRMPWPEVI
ncbi:septum site-determining protein MinC [Desulfobacter latus]|uniref:Probable septum site-determining protein MinC n=1 Tax=Desulfobacter latus TaxID=2292 RepID=A0A850SWB8_9BACT|nr:septum site-determining protein MinC [Desulfobacter latus]NWH05439.1 septum site-determining protein MinC [Desulfobacter latus]